MTTDALDRAVAEYQTWCEVERGLAKHSLAAYRRDLRRYVRYLRSEGIADVDAVTEPMVASFVDTLLAERDDEGRLRYRPASVARALVAARGFHRFCAEEGFATTDPASAIGAPRVPQGIPKALTEPEVEALLDAVDADDARGERDRALLEVLYGTGIRISECVGLDLGDIDFEAGFVRVLGKGSKERVVPLGRPAANALRAYLERGRRELLRVRRAGRTTDAVFLNTRGTRLSRQSCFEMVRTVGERVGLGGQLSPHVLRHSCATHMLDHGADIRVVQELLGHASLSTTQIYTKVSPDRLRTSYEAAHPRARERTTTKLAR
ncbi:MAG: site-specific tyrosine recombinase XerD [Acidimicrobiia bacterium]